jgi:aminoglycoside phosphotransferase (APT) family kinase protein
VGLGWADERPRAVPVTAAIRFAGVAVAVGGDGTTVRSLRRLRGGLDAETHAVRLSNGAAIVVKQMTRAAAVAAEAARLAAAEAVPVKTPACLAVDTAGEWLGRPALAMARLAGGHLGPDPRGPWEEQLARALVAIHGTSVASPPDVLLAPHAGIAWQPADHADHPSLRSSRLREAVGAGVELQSDLMRAGPSRSGALLHHDFHPGNTIWWRGDLNGVLDWNEARLGPAVCDVAYASMCIALSYGGDAARRFVDAYEAEVGVLVADLPRWRLLWSTVAARWIHLWAEADQARGLTCNTVPVLRRRLNALVDADLRR